MERGPRFEQYPEWQAETPEQQFRRELRQEAERIRMNSENELAVEIAGKIVEKVELKEQIDRINAHRDDPSVYSRLKRLGLFFAVDTKARIDWHHDESGFAVQRGESVLDLHLPPVKPEQRKLSEITRSLGLVADYIVQQELKPKYVIGITYEKLANASRRQGFTVIDVPIPPEIQAGVQRVYDRFARGEDMGKVLLCFQPTEQFVQRYRTSRPA